MAVQRTFVISFKSSGKSDIGAESFEQIIKSAVWVMGEKAKCNTTDMCALDCSIEEALEILVGSGVRIKAVDPSPSTWPT